MDDITIRLEHVDLLDSLDGLGTQLLQGCLELLVIGAGPSGSTLDLASGGALSTASSILVIGFALDSQLSHIP